ncbi:MAG: SDR family oxidoreductase [Caldilineaceae bacterium]
MIDPQLNGKVVLITGANNLYGIGAAVAKAFAQQGAKVLLTYLRLSPAEFGVDQAEAAQATEAGLPFYHARRAEVATEVVESIKAVGGWAAAFEADLSDPAQISQLFAWGEKSAGPIDILVNNAAAYQEPDTIFTATLATYRKTFDVNVGGTLLMMAEYVRRFGEQGRERGSIINLSTDSAQVFPGQINYGASKAAIEAFTRSVAVEVGPLGIRVNTIAPGPTQTGYIAAEFAETLKESIPLRRIGEPEDIADVALFLASDQARWVTGQVIKVSGGHAL